MAGKPVGPRACALLGSALLFSSACNLNNPGISPPKAQLSYPIGLALGARDATGKPTRLIVTNSNFDLKYNAASVQAFNLDVLYTLIGGTPEGGSLTNVNSCFFLSTDEQGEKVDGGIFPDNTMYPEASPPGDAGVDGGSPEGGAGADAGGDAGTLGDAGDAGALVDGAVADAGVVATASELDAGLDAGLGDAGVALDGAVPPGFIAIPSTQDYGSQRGILCDGRDGFYTPPGGAPISLQKQCCFARDNLVEPFMSVNGSPPTSVGDAPLFVNELLIDSYAQGMTITPADRAYVITRSKTRLLYIDLVDGRLSCNGQGVDDKCTEGANDKSKAEVTDTTFPSAPMALVTGKLKDLGFTADETTFVATAHDLGQVSLFLDRGNGPVLQDVLSGGPQTPTSITLASALAAPSADASSNLLYVTSASSRSTGVSRVGARVRPFVKSDGTELPAIQLYYSSPIVLTGLASTQDLRSIVVDPGDPKRLAVLIGGTQQSVAFVHLDSSSAAEVRTQNAVVVGNGPSQLETAVMGAEKRRFVFASCYDQGSIYIIDLESESKVATLDSQVLGLSGPFDMVVDEHRNLMYVSDFGASVVRVVDLSGILNNELPPPRIVATLGALTFPEGLK